MTEIKKLENELKNFRKGSDYSVSGNRRSGILYTIHSENLKQSLRDIIHSGARNDEWQIGHTFGQDGIEYVAERDNNFAVYRKSLDDGSLDGFVVLDTNQPQDASSQIWQRREKFLQSVRGIENSRKVVEESRKRNELRQQGGSFGIENYVAYSSSINERGERVLRKEENYSDSTQEQSTKEGYGYNLANEIFSELSKEPGNVFSSPQINRKGIKENKPDSHSLLTASRRDEKTLNELKEELNYLKSLPDEKGYLKKNIQGLKDKISEFERQQDFTQHQLSPEKR
jgi:hypothetical protein